MVVVGRWNRAILTPQGIVTRLFNLTDPSEVGVEVPMDDIGPFRVSYDKVTVLAGDTRLQVEPNVCDFPTLQKAMRVACVAMDSLPHTPVVAAGFNLKTWGEGPGVDSLLTATELEWDRKFVDRDYLVERRDVTWVIRRPPGKISVFLGRSGTDPRVQVNLNFECVSTKVADLISWLSQPVEGLRSESHRLLTTVLGLRPEDVSWAK